MAEVKIKGLKQIEANLQKYIQDIRTDERLLKAIGSRAVEYIVDSTAAGNDGYDRSEISQKWATERADLAESNTVDQVYPGSFNTQRKNEAGKVIHGYSRKKDFKLNAGTKSTLTFTGQLLDSLMFSIANAGSINLFFNGTHTPYKNANGKSIGKPVENSKIAEGLAQKKKILFFSENLRKQLEEILAREVRRKIQLYQSLRKKVGGISDD